MAVMQGRWNKPYGSRGAERLESAGGFRSQNKGRRVGQVGASNSWLKGRAGE